MCAKALCPRVAGTCPSLYPRSAATHLACSPSHGTLLLTHLRCRAKHRARQLQWTAASAVSPTPGDDERIRAPSSTRCSPPQSALSSGVPAAGDTVTSGAATDQAPVKATSDTDDTSAVKRALKRALRGIDRTGHVVALMLHGSDSANPQSQRAAATLYGSSSSSSSGGGGAGSGTTGASTGTQPPSDVPLADDPLPPASVVVEADAALWAGPREPTAAAAASSTEQAAAGADSGGGGAPAAAAVQREASTDGSDSSGGAGKGRGGSGEGQGGLREQLQLLASLCGEAEAMCGQLLAAGEDSKEGKAALTAAPAAGGVVSGAAAGDRSELMQAQVRRIRQLRRAAQGVLREQQQQAGGSATSAKGSREMQVLRRQLRISTFSPAAPAATLAAAVAADEAGSGTAAAAAAGSAVDSLQEAREAPVAELEGPSAMDLQEAAPPPPPTPSSTPLRRHGPIRVRIAGPATSTTSAASSAATSTYPPAAASSSSSSASPPSPPSSSSSASSDPAQDGAATHSSSAAPSPAAAPDRGMWEHKHFVNNPPKDNVLAGLLAAEALNWCVLAAATHLFLPPGLGRWARWLCYSVSATKLAKGVAVSQHWGGGRGDGSNGGGQRGE